MVSSFCVPWMSIDFSFWVHLSPAYCYSKFPLQRWPSTYSASFILLLSSADYLHHYLLNSNSGIIKNDKAIITFSIVSLWSMQGIKQSSDTWQMGMNSGKFTLISRVIGIHTWETAEKEVIRNCPGIWWLAQSTLAITFCWSSKSKQPINTVSTQIFYISSVILKWQHFGRRHVFLSRFLNLRAAGERWDLESKLGSTRFQQHSIQKVRAFSHLDLKLFLLQSVYKRRMSYPYATMHICDLKIAFLIKINYSYFLYKYM